MDEDAKRLLAAIRQDLAGRQKSAAMTVYPDVSQGTAEARMSRLLAGEFGDAVWRTLALLLREQPPPHALLDVLAELAHVTWTPQRRDPAETLAHVEERQLELLDLMRSLTSEVHDAREMLAEARRGPARAPATRPDTGRRRA
jgi:hypothetical protein